MLFAISLTGWGKIHAVLALVERLPESGPRRDEVIRYLLRYGCENGVQNGYLALPIATAAKLDDALASPAPDADLLLGAGVILSSLAEDAAQGGPAGDFGEYPEGAVAAERYVGAVPGSTAGERLDSFLAVASLRAFARDLVPHDPARWLELGWTSERCELILERADAYLALPRWRDQA